MADPAADMERAADVNAVFHPVRIDSGVVIRPASPATETIHSYLSYLRSQGLTCVPEPLGVRDGVERLAFIPGDSGGRGWYHQHTSQGLRSAARLLRRIHDVGAGWLPPRDAVFGSPSIAGEDMVFCHGDPGPWNFVWSDHEAIALIDWDFLYPGPRLNDVAYALRWFTPMRSDQQARDWHHFPAVPDRNARISTFVESYGDLPDFDVVDRVLDVMQATSDHVLSLARQGIEPQRTWVAEGSEEREAHERSWIEDHRSEF